MYKYQCLVMARIAASLYFSGRGIGGKLDQDSCTVGQEFYDFANFLSVLRITNACPQNEKRKKNQQQQTLNSTENPFILEACNSWMIFKMSCLNWESNIS